MLAESGSRNVAAAAQNDVTPGITCMPYPRPSNRSHTYDQVEYMEASPNVMNATEYPPSRRPAMSSAMAS